MELYHQNGCRYGNIEFFTALYHGMSDLAFGVLYTTIIVRHTKTHKISTYPLVTVGINHKHPD
jgi:hypothetical protein